MKNKVLAIHLPQFHRIRENDQWWEEGFTEWTNTKKATPLFKGHRQPRCPENNNYYDLSEKGVLEQHCSEAKSIGIDGFCFYHYWFDGKRVLEKPLEYLLNNKSIDVEFILSWANEPWTRSWDGKTKNILLDQVYGLEEDWIKHYKCLRRFFLDDRYIKIHNKPVFVIYRTNSIKNCDKMIKKWNEMCLADGFDGIYIVETLNGFQKTPVLKESEAVFEFEPMYTLRHSIGFFQKLKRLYNKITGALDKVSYSYVSKKIVERNLNYGKKNQFLGSFVGWDNTARKGKNALIMNDNTPELFYYQLKTQIKKFPQDSNHIMFINSWNEWAEGAYLEKDVEYGDSFQNVVRKILVEKC